jgi:hypothetical protein
MTSAGIALLYATLIGVFITPDGIVVGSDSALSNLAGQVAREQKYCVTGPKSVATLQGSYQLQDTVTKATVGLYDRFRDLCSQLHGSLAPLELQDQLNQIANGLKTDLERFLGTLPAADVIQMYSSNPVVARIAVTGYGKDGAQSIVVGLGVATDRATNRWEARVSPLPRLSFSGCGVRFHGQDGVVGALRNEGDVRLAPAELQNPDVTRLAGLIRGNCAGASPQSASTMFLQAVRLTVTFGPGFGIPQGTVGMPADVIVIPREGGPDVTRHESW